MNGTLWLNTRGVTNPSYEGEESERDQDEAVVSPTPSPSLVVEDLDARREEGNVQSCTMIRGESALGAKAKRRGRKEGRAAHRRARTRDRVR